MPFIKLDPHTLGDLPNHPDIDSPSSQDVASLIQTILLEADPLLTKLRSNLQTDSKGRPSPPSKAKVELSQGLHDNEFWVCRQSDHQDSAIDGTGSWREFEAGLRHNHAEHEMEYTPSVTKVKQLLNWDKDSHFDSSKRIEVLNTGYKDFIVELNLIVHTFHPQALIRPRAFISWTVSASFETKSENGEQSTEAQTGFITVQVPFRLPNPTEASEYGQLCAEIRESVPPRTIFGHYASIERVELVAPTTLETSSGRLIQWTMATTSEAGGKIPQWVQRNWTLGGVPKAVVADVGLFIGWVMKRRKGRLEEE